LRELRPAAGRWLALAVLAAAPAAPLSCGVDARSGDAGDAAVDADADADSDTDVDGGQDECGDVVHEGDAVVHTAADIGALAGVTRIAGDLIVSGTTLADVDGLESLACVDGDVYVGNTQSWSATGWLDGLCNLRFIGGSLGLEFNDSSGNAHVALEGVGLYALEEVAGGVVIPGNTFASLVGLENLARIGGTGCAWRRTRRWTTSTVWTAWRPSTASSRW